MADQITAGEVEITLAGQTYTLKPTLAAALAVGRMGGWIAMARRLGDGDITAAVALIAAGLGKDTPKNIEELVYREGLARLVDDRFVLINYLQLFNNNLANGGRPFDEAEEHSEGNGLRAVS